MKPETFHLKKNYLFNLLDKVTCKEPSHLMTITHDKYVSAYCLSKKVDNVVEILLSKKMNDKKEFTEEVKNLSKYFNAVVVEI